MKEGQICRIKQICQQIWFHLRLANLLLSNTSGSLGKKQSLYITQNSKKSFAAHLVGSLNESRQIS